MHQSNLKLKKYALSKGVHMWQIAKAAAMHEKTLCVKLREPLSSTEIQQYIQLVDAIANKEV